MGELDLHPSLLNLVDDLLREEHAPLAQDADLEVVEGGLLTVGGLTDGGAHAHSGLDPLASHLTHDGPASGDLLVHRHLASPCLVELRSRLLIFTSFLPTKGS